MSVEDFKDLDIDWEKVAASLSKVECCQMVIKSNNEFEDVILFVTSDISPKGIMKAFDTCMEVEGYFSFLILSEEELEYWNRNAREILYQRKCY